MPVIKEQEHNKDLKSLNSGNDGVDGQTLAVKSDKTLASKEILEHPQTTDNHVPKEIIVSSTRR